QVLFDTAGCPFYDANRARGDTFAEKEESQERARQVNDIGEMGRGVELTVFSCTFSVSEKRRRTVTQRSQRKEHRAHRERKTRKTQRRGGRRDSQREEKPKSAVKNDCATNTGYVKCSPHDRGFSGGAGGLWTAEAAGVGA